MNLTLAPATLTPAQELEELCTRLPKFFQLDDATTAERATPLGRLRVQSRGLLVDAGLGWEPGGLAVETESNDVQETETTGATFEAVCHYCNRHQTMMVMTLNVNRGPEAAAYVWLGRAGESSLGCDAYARTMGEAGVLALSRALRVWGQA